MLSAGNSASLRPWWLIKITLAGKMQSSTKVCTLNKLNENQEKNVFLFKMSRKVQGFHLLLHPEPPDAISDLLQSTLAAKTLWHLNGAQVPNLKLRIKCFWFCKVD